MNTTLASDDIEITSARSGPTAVALSVSVEAVRDALDHMDDEAVLSVPVGTPHENFDVVEWCAANRKPVINRFDPWPLETLLVRNSPADDSADAAPSPTAPATGRTDNVVDPGRGGLARRGFRRLGRRGVAGDRTLDQAWHASNVASTRSRMTVGLV